MNKTSLPIPLARKLLRVMPPPVLARGTEVIVALMRKRHPKLFKNMARLDPALVRLNPTDLPYQFALRMGPDPDFTLYDGNEDSFDAFVSGSLECLIDMLEGRVDGDALFFARQLRVTGSTEVIVALRNTMDREEINLYDEILAVCGPFASPVTKVVDFMQLLAAKYNSKKGAS